MSAIIPTESGSVDEVDQLRFQLQSAHMVARRLRVTFLGLRDDVSEVTGPVRLHKSETALKQSVAQAQTQLDELEEILGPTTHNLQSQVSAL